MTKDIIEIIRNLGENCYICGRSETEFFEFINKESIKKEIEEKYLANLNYTSETIKKYISSLKNLNEETKDYKDNLTINDLMKDEELSLKIAPKYKELLMFAPRYKVPEKAIYYQSENSLELLTKNKTTIKLDKKSTLKDIKNNILKLIKDLENSFLPEILESLEPEIFNEIKYKTGSSKNIETIRRTDYVDNFKEIRFSQVKDINGKLVSSYGTYRGKNLEFIYYYPEKKIKDSFGDKIVEKNDEIDPKNIVKVRLTGKICPMCSDQFYNASQAAFRVYEEERKKHEEWD